MRKIWWQIISSIGFTKVLCVCVLIVLLMNITVLAVAEIIDLRHTFKKTVINQNARETMVKHPFTILQSELIFHG
jgi:hypothetical protein